MYVLTNPLTFDLRLGWDQSGTCELKLRSQVLILKTSKFQETSQKLITNLSLVPGGPMDHSGPIPMVNDFGGMTPEPNFMNQSPGQGAASNGPNNNPDHVLGGGPRGSSPSEFMSSGNFSEPPNMQSEGLVW